MSARPSSHLAVVGAGLSGLTAARSLADHGRQVTLFEKSRGPGGRMATRRTDGYVFDHGAQYFTVRDERFRRHVASWIEAGLVQPWPGKFGVAKQGTVTSKDGETVRYVGTPRMSALTRHLADGLDIRFNSRVAQIERSAGRWQLFDEKHDPLGTFDGVIVTTPPAQAAPLLSEAPDLARQVEAVEMQPSWAVMTVFDAPSPLSHDGLFVHASPLSWVARNSSKPGRPAPESWVLHAAPDWSRAHLEENPQTIVASLLEAFFEATGLAPVKPVFAQAHRWRYAMAEDPLEAGSLWQADLHLGVCGDWCHNARVEGAFLSGLTLAGRMLGLPEMRASQKATERSRG